MSYSTTPDDGQETFPKLVEFYSKNKFEKLVHLVGFIIRIYHDARSSECQKSAFIVRTVHPDNLKEYFIYYQNCTCTYYTE